MTNLIRQTIHYRTNVIVILVIIGVIMILYFLAPTIMELVYKKPLIQASAIPLMVNVTIEDNQTVSKRVELKFTDVVSLLKPKIEAEPGIDKHFLIDYDETGKTKEYFVYLIANNSKYVFPEGTYEGIIRFYYKGNDGLLLNKAIPLDITVTKNLKMANHSVS